MISRDFLELEKCANWDIAAQSGPALAQSLGTVPREVCDGFVRRTGRAPINAARHLHAKVFAKAGGFVDCSWLMGQLQAKELVLGVGSGFGGDEISRAVCGVVSSFGVLIGIYVQQILRQIWILLQQRQLIPLADAICCRA
jgi:hypothetical protein